MYEKIIEKLTGQKIAILGFGREGQSTYKFIRKYLPNQELTIIDKNNIQESSSDLIKNDSKLNFVYGNNYLDNLNIYDLIIKTPGITLKDVGIEQFKERITSQIELLLEVNHDNVIGITGTKGKSTTSSLIYETLKANNKKVYLLGNIGVPVLSEVESYDKDTILVVEMSSHQLEFIKTSPHIGIILNLYEDHLDHAGSVENYYNHKMNMFKYQSVNDIGIYCYDNEALKNRVESNNYNATLYRVTKTMTIDNKTIYLKNNKIIYNNETLYNTLDKRNLIGDHNVTNIMFVLLVAKLLNLNITKTVLAINSFKPLEHRLELVGTYNDITFYNDTIATIPEATINGIESLKTVNTLIFGGMDRKINYKDFIEYLKNSKIDNLICMPTTGYTIGKAIQESSQKNIYFTETLDEAVAKAKEVTKKGMICLLSPAASSYEYFKNFEEKGNYYKSLLRK